MPIGEFFGALGRRWVLVLVGVLLTAGLGGAAYSFFKPTYEITGTVLLLPPSSSVATASENPYLQLGGLEQAVDLVGVSLSDQSTQLEMQAISKDVSYTVQADPRTSSPLLLIDVKDSSPATALRIRDLLLGRVPVRLDAMQGSLSVSVKDRVTSTVVTLDSQALEVGKNRLRAAVVVGVLGLGLTLVAAAWWDVRQMRRPRRVKIEEPPTDTAVTDMLTTYALASDMLTTDTLATDVMASDTLATDVMASDTLATDTHEVLSLPVERSNDPSPEAGETLPSPSTPDEDQVSSDDGADVPDNATR